MTGPAPSRSDAAVYYQDATTTLYHGDALSLMLPAADVVLTDPPYGTDFYESDRPVPPEFFDSLTRTYRAVAIFGYPELLIRWIIEGGLPGPSEWVTWWPTNGHVYGNPRLLPRECEHIAIWGDIPGAKRLRRPRSSSATGLRITADRGKDSDTTRLGDVWRDAAPGKGFQNPQRLHPNEKPVTVMRKLVELCSEPGDTIFDPFAGSGTTLRAAKDLGRRAIGIECVRSHCDTAVSRLAQEVLVA